MGLSTRIPNVGCTFSSGGGDYSKTCSRKGREEEPPYSLGKETSYLSKHGIYTFLAGTNAAACVRLCKSAEVFYTNVLLTSITTQPAMTID